MSDAGKDYIRIDACDLCGQSRSVAVANRTGPQRQVLLCTGCGLMYISPRLSNQALIQHYDEEFVGDAGSAARTLAGRVAQHKVAKEERLVKDWAGPLVKRYFDPQGKVILNLRCRTGALSAYLQAEGASVYSVDPFEPNLDVARQVRGLSQLHRIALTDFEEIAIPGLQTVDAVLSLNVHVLAHLSAPSRFLKRLFAMIKPGGYLILDEKDRLLPYKHIKKSIFETGDAHNYHFTSSTMARAARAAGFEVINCKVDPHRATGFRHIVLVARKPQKPGAEQLGIPEDALPNGGELSAAEILRRVQRVERTCRRQYGAKRFIHSLRRAVRTLRPSS